MRQENNLEYQIRINGKAVSYFTDLGADETGQWLKVVDDNPEDFVDLCVVRTEILFSPHRYFAMQRNFRKTLGGKQ